MNPRWSYFATLAAVVLLLATVSLLRTSAHQSVALLERLAPRIERAKLLAPEARDTIAELVERAKHASIDTRYHVRRQMVIDRVAAALEAKAAKSDLGTVGQRPSE